MSRTVRKLPLGYSGRWFRKPKCMHKYRQVGRCLSQELPDCMTASVYAQLKTARCGKSYQPNGYDDLYISGRVREAQLPAKRQLPKLYGLLETFAWHFGTRRELVAVELRTSRPDAIEVPEQSPLHGRLYHAASGHWTVRHRLSTRHWNARLLPRGWFLFQGRTLTLSQLDKLHD